MKTISKTARHDLWRIIWGAPAEQWPDTAFSDLCADCPRLFSLQLSQADKFLTNASLQSIAGQCLTLRELSIRDGALISDMDMAAAVKTCGDRLKLLTLSHCPHVSRLTMQAITQHCSNLCFLELTVTALKTPDIIEMVIIPNCLPELLRLTVSVSVFNAIVKSSDLSSRWKRTLEKMVYKCA